MVQPLLAVSNLTVCYGAIVVLHGISFQVKTGQIVSLIGANGAGKSTTLNRISGLLKSDGGTLTLEEQDITHWRPDRIVRAGLIQVPEGRQVIATLTVQENLEMGAYARLGGWFGDIQQVLQGHKPRGAKAAGVEADIEVIFERFPRLKERRRQRAGSLSGGEQQMLALGRALVARPKLMMLDEPSMGLAPVLVKEVFDIIRALKAEGKTILLVEQNARKALDVSDYVYVLERGRLVGEGPASELRRDEKIIEAYLG